MSEAPSYLALLNGISNAESNAHCWFTAWIEKTTNPDVKRVLQTVAAREGEHGLAFAKRINELGYHVRQKDDPKFAEQLEVARSSCSDLEKMDKLGVGRLDTGSRPDIFDDFFKDHTIDIRTGELLGRYIAEEHDTARLLSACHRQLAAGRAQPSGDLAAKVDALQASLDELRSIVLQSAQVKTNGKNGRSRAKAAAAN